MTSRNIFSYEHKTHLSFILHLVNLHRHLFFAIVLKMFIIIVAPLDSPGRSYSGEKDRQ